MLHRMGGALRLGVTTRPVIEVAHPNLTSANLRCNYHTKKDRKDLRIVSGVLSAALANALMEMES
jgi:hypothetical protein